MTSQDPSAALASLLALISQTQPQLPIQQIPPSISNPPSAPYALHPAHVEPVFVEGDILDTSPWIGTLTTPWHSPHPWSLPLHSHSQRHAHQTRLQTQTTPISPPPTVGKRKRSPSPPIRVNGKVKPEDDFKSYSHALKYVVQKTQDQDGEFMRRLRRMKARQHDFETDLFDERSSILRKYQAKRKMDLILRSLGPEKAQGEHVFSPFALLWISTMWLTRIGD